ncbi:MAG: hypothetical protein ABIN74_09465 [Ferruginibacter sp.]
MSEQNPILNGLYDQPKLFYRTLPDGSLDYDKVIKGRRSYDPTINTPIPVKKGKQGSLLDLDHFNETTETHLINLTRKEAKGWCCNYIKHCL